MIYLLVFLLVTTSVIMIPGRKASLVLTGTGIFIIAAASTWMSVLSLSGAQEPGLFMQVFFRENMANLVVCDKLSAFFILVINFTMITGFLYAAGYLKSYTGTKPRPWIKLHYLALLWLQASMIMVTLFRNGFWFLVVWEMMTLSSFILVIFDFDAKGTVRAGLSYLVQMHIGMLFILAALLLSSKGADTVSFDNLHAFFSNHPNCPLFILFFTGFGLKAGFFFLHTWLPDAHPAAPSHVSAIMSGVMIKLGIYGILRVATYLANDLAVIGAIVILISAVTGIFGVMMAILQHDIKKLLAYHSIENIGIIGLGIGLGIYGSGTGNIIMSAAGYAGALLHTLNHSLFKSLLFYSSGSVISRLHTRNVEKLGGLMKLMPYTGWAFLIGAMAISGLPPLNGFISEFLIYTSLFNGISSPGFYSLIIIFTGLLSLVLIGGLALLCFTKAFGIVFLGQARTDYSPVPTEVENIMLLAKFLPSILIVLIGILPVLIIRPLLSLTGSVFSLPGEIPADLFYRPFSYISLSAGILAALLAGLLAVRYLVTSRKKTLAAPTWGCGYTAVDARQQYTASSFTQEYASLTKPLIKTGFTDIKYDDEEIFPPEKDFHTHSDDPVRSRIIYRAADFVVRMLRKAAIFQTGRLQQYILYLLLFLLLIFLLTFLKII